MLDGAARPIRPYFSRSFLRGKRSAVDEKSGRPGNVASFSAERTRSVQNF